MQNQEYGDVWKLTQMIEREEMIRNLLITVILGFVLCSSGCAIVPLDYAGQNSGYQSDYRDRIHYGPAVNYNPATGYYGPQGYQNPPRGLP
jgi:hypothetical protein